MKLLTVFLIITDEFGDLLKQSEQNENSPSCSLAEALEKQDLFINASLVQMGCSLLWNLFIYGLTPYREFFHNLEDFNTYSLKFKNGKKTAPTEVGKVFLQNLRTQPI